LNIENLFVRPTAMSFASDASGRKAIGDRAPANAIVAKRACSVADDAELMTRRW
jgi:hypothetical protein